MRRALFLSCIVLASCRQPKSGFVATQQDLASAAQDERYVIGMNYDPVDRPLSWTPDGVLIAHIERYSSADVFGSTCDGSGFYRVLETGRVDRILTGRPACVAAESERVAVMPGGRRVIFSARREVNRSGLYILDLSTGVMDSLPLDCSIYLENPAISRTGAWVAGDGMCDSRQDSWGIHLFSVDGAERVSLNSHQNWSYREAAWAPDESRIVFGRDSAGLTVYNRGTGEYRDLGPGGQPSWSPDGEWIAFFVSGDHPHTGAIRVMRPDGTDDREVFRNRPTGTYSRGWGPMPEGEPFGPIVWSPTSTEIAFSREFDYGRSVWRLDLQSGTLVPLVAGGS